MPKTEVLDRADDVISSWLSLADESPAGPLYTGRQVRRGRHRRRRGHHHPGHVQLLHRLARRRVLLTLR